VREITDGSFVEAKQEKRWLVVRPLWSNPKGESGSGHAGRLPRFIAEKRLLKLCFPEAADRH
jgi:hypothetical protein